MDGLQLAERGEELPELLSVRLRCGVLDGGLRGPEFSRWLFGQETRYDEE